MALMIGAMMSHVKIPRELWAQKPNGFQIINCFWRNNATSKAVPHGVVWTAWRQGGVLSISTGRNGNGGGSSEPAAIMAS
jgi:hypothetical protein